jgi:hypothetical protein
MGKTLTAIILTNLTTAGWWAFAMWPTMISSTTKQQTCNMIIIFPILASMGCIAWGSYELLMRWED